jgi:hypothetical protein
MASDEQRPTGGGSQAQARNESRALNERYEKSLAQDHRFQAPAVASLSRAQENFARLFEKAGCANCLACEAIRGRFASNKKCSVRAETQSWIIEYPC